MSRSMQLTCVTTSTPITSQYGFTKINKGVYAHPQFRRGDKEGLTQLRKRVKASRSSSTSSPSNKITPPSSPTSSRMVSPPMSPTQLDYQHPLQHHHQQQQHDASSERLLILAQAVRVAMVLEAGSNVSKESNIFPSVYC